MSSSANSQNAVLKSSLEDGKEVFSFPWEEEEAGYEIPSSCVDLTCNLIWFSYICPKMRNFISIGFGFENETQCRLLDTADTFYILHLKLLFSCSLGEQGNCAVVAQ